MIVQPKIRGFICTTAHPVGCEKNVLEQIEYVNSKGAIENGPKKVLVIGASTGYGLSSRIEAAFGCQAATVGVFFEREAEGKRTATAGWYNTVAFEKKAREQGLYAQSFNGDAFSDELKAQVCERIKNDLGQVDLIIYSLASPRRQHPRTGKLAKSVLRPIGKPYTNMSIDMSTDKLEEVSLPVATDEEIEQTVSVMGGEDWEFWIEALDAQGLIAQGAITMAYTYVGPEVTRPVYRNGTIGRAKAHLEETAKRLDQRFKKFNGHAVVSANKALVTQSSSAIPFIPLYFIVLNKIMKEKNLDEDCIAQIYRLFSTRLYNQENIVVDESGLIRLDDYEMQDDVQNQVNKVWGSLAEETFRSQTDLDGYHKDFLRLFGFGMQGVNYDEDVEVDLKLQS